MGGLCLKLPGMTSRGNHTMPSIRKEETENIVLFPVVKVNTQGADTSTVLFCSLEFSDDYITSSRTPSTGELCLDLLML